MEYFKIPRPYISWNRHFSAVGKNGFHVVRKCKLFENNNIRIKIHKSFPLKTTSIGCPREILCLYYTLSFLNGNVIQQGKNNIILFVLDKLIWTLKTMSYRLKRMEHEKFYTPAFLSRFYFFHRIPK